MRLSLAACGTRRRSGRARHPDLARYATQNAEQGEQQFPLALPVETAEANDFAGVGGERDVAQAVRPVEIPHLEQWRLSLGARRRLRREDVAVLAPDHHFDDFVVGLRSGQVGRDIGAVPEHRALVSKLGDLMHAVRNVEERQSFLAQALEDDEHLGDISRRERRSRLVENKQARLARQRLGDLDHLPARQRQVLDQRHRMDFGRPQLARAPPRRDAAARAGRSSRNGAADWRWRCCRRPKGRERAKAPGRCRQCRRDWRRRAKSKATSAPSSTIRPESGATTPDRILMRVDLPAPFSPRIA